MATLWTFAKQRDFIVLFLQKNNSGIAVKCCIIGERVDHFLFQRIPLGHRRIQNWRFLRFVYLLDHVVPVLNFVFVVAVSILYLMSLSYWQLPLGLIHCVHYLFFFEMAGGLVATQSCYFFLLCLYVKYSLEGVLERFKNLIPLILNQNLTRNRFLEKFLKKEIQSTCDSVALVRSCNNYFGQQLKLFVVLMATGALGSIYAISNAESESEIAFFLFSGFYACACAAFLFLSASAVKTKVRKLSEVVNGMQSKMSLFRMKWRVGLVAELLASKRNRVGFQLRHWCHLNNFTFVKV